MIDKERFNEIVGELEAVEVVTSEDWGKALNLIRELSKVTPAEKRRRSAWDIVDAVQADIQEALRANREPHVFAWRVEQKRREIRIDDDAEAYSHALAFVAAECPEGFQLYLNALETTHPDYPGLRATSSLEEWEKELAAKERAARLAAERFERELQRRTKALTGRDGRTREMAYMQVLADMTREREWKDAVGPWFDRHMGYTETERDEPDTIVAVGKGGETILV